MVERQFHLCSVEGIPAFRPGCVSVQTHEDNALDFRKAGLDDSIYKPAYAITVLDSREDFIRTCMKTILTAVKRGEWADIVSLTSANVQVRPDR